MDHLFLKELMERTNFPAEARSFLTKAADQLISAGAEALFAEAVAFYGAHGFSARETQPLVEKTAAKAGLSPFTVWLFVLVESAIPAREDFRRRGIPEQIFWDTFADLRYKALECKEVQGVWGNFVAFWYDIFYTGKIVKLGRLEFETCEYFWDEPYTWGDITLKKGDRVRSIHIPSSGEPFDGQARLDAYQRAYEFFWPELDGGPLICVCHSWLLYPPYKDILSPASNIVGFMGDFDIIGCDTEEEFGDCWRLFGADYQKPAADLPEETSMQRAFKRYLLAGGKPGEGRGVLLFDGEKILNNH